MRGSFPVRAVAFSVAAILSIGVAYSAVTPTPTVSPTFEPIPVYSDPVAVTELNSSADDSRPYLTGDLLEVFFISTRAGGGSIWSATRESPADAWNPPYPVTELCSGDTEWNPVLRADGLEIFFGSDRGLLPTNNWNRVFRATRPDRSSPWTAPFQAPELNPPQMQDCHTQPSYLSEDGLRLYTHRSFGADYDLYVSSRGSVGGSFCGPTPLPGVNTAYSEAHPALSGDERTMIFARQTDQWRLYAAKRHDLDSDFVVVREVEELNASACDTEGGFVSADLSHTWFSSNRPGSPNPNGVYIANILSSTPSAEPSPAPTFTPTHTLSPTPSSSTGISTHFWR